MRSTTNGSGPMRRGLHPKDMLQAVCGSTPESQKAEFQELADGLST